MTVRTSVTLSPELLASMDRAAGNECSRSQFIGQVVRDFLRRADREARRVQEVARLNAIADGRLGEPPDVEDYSAQVGDEFEP